MKTKSATWELTDKTATFQCQGLQGHLALDSLSRGMSLGYQSDPIKGSLWAFPAHTLSNGTSVLPKEVYVRGEDLVVALPPTKDLPCETIWYWSVSPCFESNDQQSNNQGTEGVTIRLTLSLLTDLLDSKPELELESSLAGENPKNQLEEIGVARHLTSQAEAWTLYEVSHPSDHSECLADKVGETETLKIKLPFLEKGVIRRARLAAFFLPDNENSADLSKVVAEFVNEPLPLTT